MGASSITGVSGPGSSEGNIKGPSNHRNIYVALQQPYILAADANVDCFQGQAGVRISAPPNVTLGLESYNVLVTGQYGNITVEKHNDINGVFSYFTIFTDAGQTDRVDWAVTTIGIGAKTTN